MALYGFNDRFTALRLKQMATTPTNGVIELGDSSVSWLFRTPVAGIAAFTDAVPYADQELPSAECEAWYLYLDDLGKVKRRQGKNLEGDPLKAVVANMLSDAIPGSIWIGATQYVGGVFLVDWMDCADV